MPPSGENDEEILELVRQAAYLLSKNVVVIDKDNDDEEDEEDEEEDEKVEDLDETKIEGDKEIIDDPSPNEIK